MERYTTNDDCGNRMSPKAKLQVFLLLCLKLVLQNDPTPSTVEVWHKIRKYNCTNEEVRQRQIDRCNRKFIDDEEEDDQTKEDLFKKWMPRKVPQQERLERFLQLNVKDMKTSHHFTTSVMKSPPTIKITRAASEEKKSNTTTEVFSQYWYTRLRYERKSTMKLDLRPTWFAKDAFTQTDQQITHSIRHTAVQTSTKEHIINSMALDEMHKTIGDIADEEGTKSTEIQTDQQSVFLSTKPEKSMCVIPLEDYEALVTDNADIKQQLDAALEALRAKETEYDLLLERYERKNKYLSTVTKTNCKIMENRKETEESLKNRIKEVKQKSYAEKKELWNSVTQTKDTLKRKNKMVTTLMQKVSNIPSTNEIVNRTPSNVPTGRIHEHQPVILRQDAFMAMPLNYVPPGYAYGMPELHHCISLGNVNGIPTVNTIPTVATNEMNILNYMQTSYHYGLSTPPHHVPTGMTCGVPIQYSTHAYN